MRLSQDKLLYATLKLRNLQAGDAIMRLYIKTPTQARNLIICGPFLILLSFLHF